MMGIPVTVTVDDNLLFEWPGGFYTAFAQPGLDGAFWVPILEKAVAKLYGNYEMLVGGQTGSTV